MGSKLETAVVLAGGEGTRLRPLTNEVPKPMIRILGKPILQWVIEWLASYGISNIVIGVSYKKEAVMNYFKDGSEFNCNIKYSVHSIEGETGEGFRLAIKRHVDDDVFLAMNGDEITNFSIKKFYNYHIKNNSIATIAVTNPRSDFGIIKIDKGGLIRSFEEKPILKNLLVSVGIYLFDRKIIDYLPLNGLIERSTFPLLVNQSMIRAFPIKGEWLTINNMKDLESVEKILLDMQKKEKWL